MRQSTLTWSCVIFVIFAVVTAAGCTQFQREKEGGEIYAPREPSTRNFCPVCGEPPAKVATNFYPANFPRWNSQIVFKSGASVHFASTKHLFHYLLGLDAYGNNSVWLEHKSIVARIYVSDYRTTEYIPAKEAYYVGGGEAEGPVGKDLAAFKSRRQAEKFTSEHGGKIIDFDGVDRELLRELKFKDWRGRY